MKEELIRNLKKYNYKFIEENDSIRIDMETWHKQEVPLGTQHG